MRPIPDEVKAMFSGAPDFMGLGWPTCARCMMPVDAVEYVRDFDANGWSFEVRCHGAREVQRLTYTAYASAVRGSIRFGEAFAAPQPPLIGHEGEKR